MDELINAGQMRLLREMKTLLGSRVLAAHFKIWPADDWPATDVRLNLKLELPSGLEVHKSFFIGQNGSAPTIDDDDEAAAYCFADLPARIEVWKEPTPWSEAESLDFERFDLSDSPQWSWIVGAVLTSAELVVWLPELEAGGLVMHFDNGHSLRTAADPDGNQVIQNAGNEVYYAPVASIRIDETLILE